MRRAMMGMLLLALFTLCSGVVALADGDPSPVTMSAEAGFDGRGKSGTWVPVTVSLKNDGPELTGEIRFEAEATYGNGKNTATYRHPVIIPAGANKRVSMLVYVDGRGMPTMSLWSGEKEVTTIRPKLETSFDVLVGVLGVEPAELKSIAGMPFGVQALRLVHLDGATVQTDPFGLESLDAIMLDRFVWNELPQAARAAVQSWVEQGGKLIAVGGPEAKRLEGLTPWAPLVLKGVDTVEVDGVGKAPLAQVDLSDWQEDLRIGQRTLAAHIRKGAGTIHFLAFDPALEPFASWAGMRTLFTDLLGANQAVLGPGGKGMGPGGQQGMMAMADALSQHPIRPIPSMKNLLMLLGLYALVIGPVHLLLLRRVSRTGWAMLTLPLLVAVGAGGVWVFTKQARGTDLATNLMSIIEGQPGGSSFKVHTMAGFFVPPGSKHTVSLGNALLQPMGVPYFQIPGGPDHPSDTKVTLVEGRSALLEPMEAWGLRAVAAEATVPGGGSLSGTLTMDGNRVEGRLTSGIPFPLKDAVIVSGSTFQNLGTIEPGASVDVSMGIFATGREMAGPMLMDGLNRSMNINIGKNGPTPEQYELMRRQRMTYGAMNVVRWMQSSDRPPIALFGWVDGNALPLSVDGKQVANEGMGLFVQPVDFGYTTGAFSIPHGFVVPKAVASEGQMMGQPMMYGWSLGKDGAATVDFEVPKGLAGRVSQMEFRVPLLKGGPGNGKFPMTFELFRWSDSSWQSVESTNGQGSVDAKAGFVSAGGKIRLRMTQTTPDRWPLGIPSLSLQGGAQS